MHNPRLEVTRRALGRRTALKIKNEDALLTEESLRPARPCVQKGSIHSKPPRRKELPEPSDQGWIH